MPDFGGVLPGENRDGCRFGSVCRFHLVMILWHCANLELVLEELEMSFSWRDGMTENKFFYHFLYHMTRVAVDGLNDQKGEIIRVC